MLQQNCQTQTKRLRELARKSNVSYQFRKHALKEMENDGITIALVVSALKTCSVYRVESNNFEETWNARISDGNGNQFTVVVVPYEDRIKIKIITAWSH